MASRYPMKTPGLFLLWLGLVSSPLVAGAFQVDMELPVVGGETESLAEHRGKWVVVNYWATWCPPCLEEIPELVAFHDAHQDRDAVVWGINFEDISPRALKGFLEEFLVSYPVSTVPPAGNTPLGPITGLPTTFLVDPEGRLVAKQTGPVTTEMLEAFIESGKSR